MNIILCYFLIMYFFFSSRRRHTRCALVTGVQTCALPISGQRILKDDLHIVPLGAHRARVERRQLLPQPDRAPAGRLDKAQDGAAERSEERRVGKEWVSTGR